MHVCESFHIISHFCFSEESERMKENEKMLLAVSFDCKKDFRLLTELRNRAFQHIGILVTCH